MNCTESLEQLTLWPMLNKSEQEVLRSHLCQCENCSVALAQAEALAEKLSIQRIRYQVLTYPKVLPTGLSQAITPPRPTFRFDLSWLFPPVLASMLVVAMLFGEFLMPDTQLKPMQLLSTQAIDWSPKSKPPLFKRDAWRSLKSKRSKNNQPLKAFSSQPRKLPKQKSYRRLFRSNAGA